MVVISRRKNESVTNCHSARRDWTLDVSTGIKLSLGTAHPAGIVCRLGSCAVDDVAGRSQVQSQRSLIQYFVDELRGS